MRIAIIAHRVRPLVTPDDGAGQMTAYAATALREAGHDVTLFAPEGSEWDGEIVFTGHPDARRPAERLVLPHVTSQRDGFDVFWDHTHAHYLSRMVSVPVVNHAHDREVGQFEIPNVVAVSEDQASEIGAQWVVKNGIDLQEFSLETDKEDYVFWLGNPGRPHKGFPIAQRAAKRARVKLLTAGPNTERGIVWGEEKLNLLQRAKALLFTAQIECGPLTVLEAQACGTPVVALEAGGTPEYLAMPSLCGGEEELPALLEEAMQVGTTEYEGCRHYVERHHSLEVFAGRMEPILRQVADAS